MKMERDQTLDLIAELQQNLDHCVLDVRWPSGEILASSVERRSNRKGQGDEFDTMKEYEPGDDIKHINWLASATEADGTYIINTHLEPRVIRFKVVLDVNPSMNFGTKGTLKSRLAAICAACGIQSATKMKDRVSFATFSKVPETVRKGVSGSRAMLDFFIHALEDGAAPSEFKPGENGGMAASLQSIESKHRSLVLVVSDFVNMKEEDWDALAVSGWKNDTVAVFVQDIRERELPEVPFPGASYSFEDYQGNTKTIWVSPDKSPGFLSGLSGAVSGIAKRLGLNAVSRKEYSENFKRHETAILDRLKACGIKTVIASTEDVNESVRCILRVLANKR